MPSFPIQLKRNGTAAATPSSLLHGEVALNYADGKLFWKDASNVIQSFTFQAYALSSHTHAASDITSGTFDAARIANDSITYAKLQNVSATDRLLGRSSAGAGDVEEISCGSFGRSLIGSADAAAARSTLSVQPTASPAFTGAATFDNTGNVVPLTVTNAGTANSFVVNDESGDTTPFVIDAAGRVVVGGSSAASESHRLSIVGTLPSVSSQSVGFIQRASVPSSSTVAVISYSSLAITDAASFTLSSFIHFRALQSAIGSGSAITSQYGFVATDTLTGATNNYGFYSDIASGTGRWNFYSNGTAENYFKGASTFDTSLAVNNTGNVVPLTVTNTGTANSFVVNDASGDTSPFVIDASGNVGIGTSSPSNKLSVSNAGAEGLELIPAQNANESRIQSYNRSSAAWNKFSVNCSTFEVFCNGGTSAISIATTAAVTLSGQLLVTAGSASAPGVAFGPSDTNTGMYSPAADVLALATNGTERVRVGSNGQIGIRGEASAFAGLHFAGTAISDSAATQVIRQTNIIPSTTTNNYWGVLSEPSTQAAAFTLTNLRHFEAAQGSLGASSVVTNQYGFLAGSTLTGATNNYGFYSNIGDAANRWNFYAAGSAKNYFNGETLIGTTTDQGDFKLQVAGNTYLENLYLSTTTNWGRLAISHAGATTFAAGWNNTDTSSTGQTTLNILRNGTSVGTISTTNTATSYNTTSDYRLKANPRPITDATDRISRIRPSQWDWHVGGVGEGFIAHELSEAVPLAVTGEKDAVDATGNPVWQTVDMSKVVPVLVAALQEANARIAALEERLNHA